MSGLIAYPGPDPMMSLLQESGEQMIKSAGTSAVALAEIATDRRGPDMTPLRRLAFIGNSLPRRCGIATFTTDLQQAISTSRPDLETVIVAMTDHGQAYDYPASVALADQGRQHRRVCARGRLPERRPVRRGLSAARIRNFRRRSRRPHPRAVVAPHHAGGDDAPHRAGRANGRATRGDGAHRRGVGQRSW